MIKKLGIILLLSLPLLLSAQQSEGVIHYQELLKIEIDLPEDMENREQIMKMLPKSKTKYKLLKFNESMALFASEEETEVADAPEEGGGGVQIQIEVDGPGGQEETFLNIETGEYVSQTEFMGRLFLIKDQREKVNWKLSGETKEIAGYKCQKATAERDSTTMEAWFAPDIPVSSGPRGIGQLPGMILELGIEDGMLTYTATKVEFMKIPAADLKAPKKGKVVSQKEYEEIVEAKMAEMREQMGGRNGGRDGEVIIEMR